MLNIVYEYKSDYGANSSKKLDKKISESVRTSRPSSYNKNINMK